MSARFARSRVAALRAAGAFAALFTLAAQARPASAAAGSVTVKDPEPARAIAILEDERRWSTGELGALLGNPSAAVRSRAALAVGRLQDSTSVPALLPLVADSSAEVRREAVFALGQIGHRSARVTLEPLVGAADPELRQLAVEALGKLGDKAATARVASALDDKVPAVRGAAATSLWRLADSTALGALIAHDGDPDPQVRWRVVWAMEKIVAPDKVVLRAALRLDDPDPQVRARAARTIGRQKSPRGTVYLLQALNDPDVGVVVNAMRSLQLAADTTCSNCASMLVRSLGSPNPYLRVTAATALGERFAWVRADSAQRRRLADSLKVHLRDLDAATRGACAKALLARTGEAALPLVRPLVEDSIVYVRVAVIEGLRSLPKDGGAGELLRARLAPPATLFERSTAAEVMGDRHDSGTGDLLRAGLADTSVLFVASCAAGLGALGESASVPVLLSTYPKRRADHEPDARLAIVDALRTLGRELFADSLERSFAPRQPSPAAHDDAFFQTPAEHGVVIHTSRGDVQWEFYGREAPQTVRNFVRLARQGYFDGTRFHRVVPDFVIQDGDPTGTGSGGPGYSIRCEYNQLRYDLGVVGMALAGKDTGGSQWFITLSPQPHLDGRYTIFARVVKGMDVAQRIVQGDRIVRVEVLP